MGLSLARNCGSGFATEAPAPNPDPKRWNLLAVYGYEHGYVLVVRYLDATNFEGVKVMVYRGSFIDRVELRRRPLDPHFTDSPDSPIARFKPNEEGIAMARALAESFQPVFAKTEGV